MPLFLSAWGKGKNMKCGLCQGKTEAIIMLRHYSREGIGVCRQCYDHVELNKGKPYSRVIERLAVAEAGYYINRKLKR